MIKSMTGYGKAVVSVENKKFTIEVKSVNGKQFDLKLRMSSMYNEKEMEIRKLLQSKLERGSIEMNVFADVQAETASAKVNPALFKQYYAQLKSLSDELDDKQSDLMALVMRMPDVMKSERPQLDAQEWVEIHKGIDQAAEAMDAFRIKEGARMAEDLTGRIDNIAALIPVVEANEQDRIDTVKERIKNGLMELKANKEADQNRFEQELIYYLEKLDITEEKVRLYTHIDHFNEVLSADKSQGKKLGFIVQEIGREINTIGSKANHAAIQKAVVQMKDELEKIKEQLGNIL